MKHRFWHSLRECKMSRLGPLRDVRDVEPLLFTLFATYWITYFQRKCEIKCFISVMQKQKLLWSIYKKKYPFIYYHDFWLFFCICFATHNSIVKVKIALPWQHNKFRVIDGLLKKESQKTIYIIVTLLYIYKYIYISKCR